MPDWEERARCESAHAPPHRLHPGRSPSLPIAKTGPAGHTMYDFSIISDHRAWKFWKVHVLTLWSDVRMQSIYVVSLYQVSLSLYCWILSFCCLALFNPGRYSWGLATRISNWFDVLAAVRWSVNALCSILHNAWFMINPKVSPIPKTVARVTNWLKMGQKWPYLGWLWPSHTTGWARHNSSCHWLTQLLATWLGTAQHILDEQHTKAWMN